MFNAASRLQGINRVIIPTTDPYFSNVAVLMHMDGVNNGTAFPDVKGNAVTVSGAKTSTANPKFGTAAADFSGGYFTLPTATFKPTATTPWTIDVWVRPNSSTPGGYILGAMNPTANAIFWGIQLGTANRVLLYSYNGAGSTVTGTTSLPAGVWSLVSISVTGTTATIYVNGVADATGVFNTPAANSLAFCVGQTINVTFGGQIDDLRITQGIARYSANFTPDIAPFPNS